MYGPTKQGIIGVLCFLAIVLGSAGYGCGKLVEWTVETWNPAVGCSRVSAGCMNCYAERVAHRGMSPQHKGLTRISSQGPQWNGTVRFVPEMLAKPLSWKKPRRVFVNSMSDLFHDGLTNEQIAAVFVMAARPQHTFQVLTKRPEQMLEWFEWASMHEGALSKCGNAAAFELAAAGDGLSFHDAINDVGRAEWPLPNVWLGVSTEDQKTADERIPLLLQAPAAKRFISAEPLLGPIDLNDIKDGHTFWTRPVEVMERALDWVIVGSESGPGARPMETVWAQSIVDQCVAAGVAVFVKQIANAHDRKGGDPQHWPPGNWPRQFPEVSNG